MDAPSGSRVSRVPPAGRLAPKHMTLPAETQLAGELTLQDQKKTLERLHFKLMVMFQTLGGRSRKQQRLNCVYADDREGRTGNSSGPTGHLASSYFGTVDMLRAGRKELRQVNYAQRTSFFKQSTALSHTYTNQGSEPFLKSSRV